MDLHLIVRERIAQICKTNRGMGKNQSSFVTRVQDVPRRPLAHMFSNNNKYLGSGVSQRNGEKEVGICTTGVNPQVPEDWSQERTTN